MVDEAVPALPALLTAAELRAGGAASSPVRAAVLSLLTRVAALHADVALWLLKQTGTSIHSFFLLPFIFYQFD